MKPNLYPSILALATLLLAACAQQPIQPEPTPAATANNHYVPYVAPVLIQPEHTLAPEGTAPLGGVVPLKIGPKALAAANGKVELRLLLISATTSEAEYLAWKQVLDRLGTPYDTLVASAEPTLTLERLTRPDGTGRYQAIFLTTNNLSYFDGLNYVSAFSNEEWNLLWQYERDYQVRQVALNGYPSTFPEDYCTRFSSALAVENTNYPIKLTPTGAQIFDYLRPDAGIPLRFSYIYKASLDAACTASNPTQVLLQDATNAVLGVTSRSSDGRERLMLNFSSNPYFFYTPMLSYGVVRWATRGLLLGERRHFLHMDVDDVFNTTDWRLANGTFAPSGYRMSASDLVATVNAQQALKTRYGALLDGFALNLAFNADAANLSAPASCNTAVVSPDRLTSVARCYASRFRWVNHSYTHLNLDQPKWAPYATSKFEIQENLRVGALLGLSTPGDVFKSGELSGYGFFDPTRTDPYGDIGKPQDFGLMSSNQEYLLAAKDAGVKYVHVNFSVPSEQPMYPNTGFYHPLQPSLFAIPVKPNNIAYYVTTPAEEVSFYNMFYGPGGLFPTFSTNQTYDQILDFESDVTLFNLITGSSYAFYFHQGNLRQYSPGRNLVMDWTNALMSKYASYYRLPIRTLPWSGSDSLGRYIEGRTSHQTLAPQLSAVWDRSTGATGTVTMTAPSTLGGRFYLTGGQVGSWQSYGGDNIADVSLNAGQSLSFVPTLR